MQEVKELKSNGVRVARFSRVAFASAMLAALVACGGGKDSTDSSEPTATSTSTPSKADASRFLGQATMGASEADIDHLSSMSYSAWFDEQFAKPQTLHRLYLNQATADAVAIGTTVSPTNFFDSWWTQALSGDDQLRQRTAFALSELFVISFSNSLVAAQPRGVASYYDMLGANTFGNFRDLLNGVAYHPMMGIFLSDLKNQKEDPTTGRVPDLNFAREVTQLFTVGEWKLNADGSQIMASNGLPTPAYTSADLSGLSQVFTGLSWYAGPDLTDRTNARFFGSNPDVSRDWQPMQDYNQYTPNTSFHSVSQKTFLGVTIAPQTTPDTVGDVKIALDTLFNNPNVGPFVGKQLIQRLVTSNPSPAYVSRVAAVFNDNGSGVRGDMQAVWKAILLDPEARTLSTSTSAGKLREPLLRMSQMLRAFNATSVTGSYTGIGLTDDPATRLGQTAMFAPTVFNFFRPGYVPSGDALSATGLVVPEMQITDELSVAGYMNFIRTWTALDTTRDIQQDYTAEKALADTPDALVDRMNLLLFGGTMPDALKTQISAAAASRVIPGPTYPAGTAASAVATTTPTNQAQMDAARLDRVYIAVFLSMASPDYLIQK